MHFARSVQHLRGKIVFKMFFEVLNNKHPKTTGDAYAKVFKTSIARGRFHAPAPDPSNHPH